MIHTRSKSERERVSESVRVRNIQSVQESSRSFMNVTSSKFAMVHLAVFNVTKCFSYPTQRLLKKTERCDQNPWRLAEVQICGEGTVKH